ncbi:hypothetical protein GWO43_08685, partial [candidate division KSB1 bacterium]|nr:hypothetical protein [candidate division KSB1 bacterium]NIR71940.1 hypothetical protein [candidate division KSB1 bacterium]NIS24035.1 hypothetical protein [candidate division KSB1 bacterium]NIT70955.1 hypothetical protein [candidate division KSB1 bacterium]NIU24685.1 hypothetical protein [candidate division KSB1 bacterium]
LGAAITLFDANGHYLRSIPVDPNAGTDRLLTELLVNEGDIYVKDERLRTIFHLNPEGKIVSKLRSEDRTFGAAQITVGEISLSESDTGRVLYTTIFNHLPKGTHLTDSFPIAAFDEQGRLLTQFAKPHPNYAKFNLSNFFVSTFAIWQNDLYLLESASHEIRVYSLTGDLLRSFGEPGYHQKVVDRKLKANPPCKRPKHSF